MIVKMKSKIGALMAGTLMLVYNAASAESFFEWATTFTRTKGVQPVMNTQYLTECGACHFAYQPALLPARSWETLLDGKALNKHFGVDAGLEKDTLQIIRDYATANAAENSFYKLARKVVSETTAGEAPLRISELRFIKRKHHSLTDDMAKNNEAVKSLSNCNACHTQANTGVFDEDTILIPNLPSE